MNILIHIVEDYIYISKYYQDKIAWKDAVCSTCGVIYSFLKILKTPNGASVHQLKRSIDDILLKQQA